LTEADAVISKLDKKFGFKKWKFCFPSKLRRA
jgi:hypothetical protein